MPRFRLSSISAFVALAIALAPSITSAQDATKVAEDAEKQITEIQKLLASGKDAAGKDNPLLMRLRVDGFKAADDKVVVSGMFIDPGAKANGDVESQVGDPAKDLILKHLKVDKPVAFNWKDVKLVGVVDDAGTPVGDVAPHILLQNAANAAGAKGNAFADQVRFDGSHFGPDGGLVIAGVRGKADEVDAWLKGALPSLEKHPAAAKGGKSRVTADVKPVEWKASAATIQRAFATAGKADGTEQEKGQYALRRLYVERAYFAYDGTTLRFRVEGLRIGDAAVEEDAADKPKPVDEVLEPIIVDAVGKKIPLNKKNLLSDVLEEPLSAVRAAVGDAVALDGVRIDPGFTFGPGGEVQPPGIQPGLTEDGRKSLESLVQAGFRALGQGKPLAAKYEQIAKRPVSVRAMTALPIAKVMADMRKWATRTKDDLKLQRLYFPGNIDALKKKYYVAADGLALVYRPANLADVKDVEDEFKRLLKVHIEAGIPAAPGAPPPKDAPTGLADKEPPLPGLTAFLRREMAADQKKWNGVLIERGYFDENGLYTLVGVVDSNEQAKMLVKLLEDLKADPKWEEYLAPKYNAPDLAVIPMKEVLDRVRRVTPAYVTFDGIRIESARYDANVNLIFDAHVVGNLDRDAAPLLAKLLSDHPTYSRRVAPGKQVRIEKLAGPAYPDDQLANFSLAFGAKLLSNAGKSKEDRLKAREWLDLALLHFPNESAVWFLNAYYNYTLLDEDKESRLELVRRDLYRVIDLEGPLAFNGPSQRKRRYEAARDFQGATRNELEAIWLDCFREVKDGARPITLKK